MQISAKLKYKKNLLISGKIMQMSAKTKWCVTLLIYFWDLFNLRYNSANFHHSETSVTDFRAGDLFAPIPSVSKPEMSILNRVKKSLNLVSL